jgi:hypothetical protein
MDDPITTIKNPLINHIELLPEVSEEKMDCPYCADNFNVSDMICWGAIQELHCKLCTLKEIRRQLDVNVSAYHPIDNPTITKYHIVSPESKTLLSFNTLNLIYAWHNPTGNERPMSNIEYNRALLWLLQESRPTEKFASCPTCSFPLTLQTDSVGTGLPISVTHNDCNELTCNMCGELWNITLSNGSITHQNKTCKSYLEDKNRLSATTNDDQNLLTNLGDFKKCPECGEGMTHYRGHACHHMVPGKGCPTCFKQSKNTHFCYVCLQPWPHVGTSVTLCPLYCTPACDCPDCPACIPPNKETGQPAIPCNQCNGSGSGCRVCSGKDYTSQLAVAEWKLLQQTSRDALLQKGWCGPQTVRQIINNPVVVPITEENPFNVFNRIINVATTTSQEMTTILHRMTIQCVSNPFYRNDSLYYIRRLYNFANRRVADERLCEGILEFFDAIMNPEGINIMGFIDIFTENAGFTLMFKIFQYHNERPAIIQRVLGTISSIIRMGMLEGKDLPIEVETMFDQFNGLDLIFKMLNRAHESHDEVVVSKCIRSLSGMRIHTKNRIQNTRENQGISLIIKILLSNYNITTHTVAIVALARLTNGLWKTWSDSDNKDINTTLDSFGTLSSDLERLNIHINVTFQRALEIYDHGLILGEVVILAGSLLRIQSYSGAWYRGRSEALARIYLPYPPLVFASEAVSILASTLKRRVANEGQLREQLSERLRNEEELANLERPPLYVQIVVSPFVLGWLVLKGCWWVMTGGVWILVRTINYGSIAVASGISDVFGMSYYVIIRPTYRYVLIPIYNIGTFIVKIINKQIIIPTGKGLYNYILTPIYNFGCLIKSGIISTGKFLNDYVIIPTGKGLYNYILTPIYNFGCWLKSGIIAIGKFLRDQIIIPTGKGIYNWILTPIYNLGCLIKTGIIATGKFIRDYIIIPIGKFIRDYIIIPTGKGIKWLSKMGYKWLIFPLCKYIGYYGIYRGLIYWLIWKIILYYIIGHTLYYSYIGAKRITNWISIGARLVYSTVLKPVGEVIAYGVVTTSRTIYNVTRAIVIPISQGISYVARTTSNAIVSVSRSIANTVRSVLRSRRR